jgi:hypothetical protein
MDHKFKRWTALASHFIGEHFDQCKPLLDKDYEGMSPIVRFVSTQLYLSCQFSTESSLLLLQQGQEWDAEIINRSIIEGVVKYIFMLQGTDEEVLEKVNEYWEILPSYSSVKRSDRVNSLLNDTDSEVLQNSKSLENLKLTEPETETIREGTNRQQRKLLEQKWSFSNIIQGFSKSNDKWLAPLIHLAYNFGMSSHLIHKDGDGVGMVWERCTREKERQEVVKLAHVARTISDLCSFAEIRTTILHKRCNEPDDFSKKIKESYSLLFSELKVAYDKFNQVEYET